MILRFNFQVWVLAFRLACVSWQLSISPDHDTRGLKSTWQSYLLTVGMPWSRDYPIDIPATPTLPDANLRYQQKLSTGGANKQKEDAQLPSSSFVSAVLIELLWRPTPAGRRHWPTSLGPSRGLGYGPGPPGGDQAGRPTALSRQCCAWQTRVRVRFPGPTGPWSALVGRARPGFMSAPRRHSFRAWPRAGPP